MDRAFVPTHPRIAELERLGDEIAELSAHLDAAVLADPAQPGQSVLEGGERVSAELVSAEPGAEPDPGRFEVLRIVDTATCAVTTHREILPR